LEPQREPSSFDPSRFGEIEISPELRAKFMNFELSRVRQAKLEKHSNSEPAAPGLPEARTRNTARLRLFILLGTIVLLVIGALAAMLHS
jgi:hypothetical protein